MKHEIKLRTILLSVIILVLFCSGCSAESGRPEATPSQSADYSYVSTEPAAIFIACPSCDRQIPVESDFCMYCGKSIYPINTSQNEPQAPTPATPQPSVYPTVPPQNQQPTSIPSAPQPSVWSEWSTAPVSQSSGVEVQTRMVTKEYHMVHYGTQAAEPPYVRMFRNYSILGSFDKYGARDSYGEKHFTRTVTADELERATQYKPGDFIPGDYQGYQKGSDIAYSFGDDKYVWFVETAVPVTEYRYRYLG